MSEEDVLRRPLSVRMRPDLVIQPPAGPRAHIWLLKDPLTLHHFRLRTEEYWLLTRLDGQRSWDSIREEFERTFAPARLSLPRLQALISRWHHEGLVLGTGPEQGERLLEAHRRQLRRTRWQALTKILAMRFRGIDPDPLLRRLAPRCRWLFSPWSLALGLMLVASALLLVSVQFSSLQAELPAFEKFFRPANLLALALVLAGIKVLHELGHALTCRHFGGECHELGFMLLVFTPCLYCDVSDSWMLTGRWRRAAVAAAGMWVEAMLAAAATWLWWLTRPGLLHDLCLNVMFVAGVGTLLFNGNPLLRYDGYFLLSDLLDWPNLWQESRRAVQHGLTRWFSGLDLSAEQTELSQSPLVLWLYGLSSMAYRAMVLVGILLFVLHWTEAFGLRVAGAGIAAMSLGGLVYAPLALAWRVWRHPGLRSRVRPSRMGISLAILGLMLAFVLGVPLPYDVEAPVHFAARRAERVYVIVPGWLRSSVQVQATVRAGETLGQLENADLQREWVRYHGECERLEARLRALESRRGTDPAAASQLPTVQESLRDAQDRREQIARDRSRLKLVSSRNGTVLSPPPVPPPSDTERNLPRWTGSPLDARNAGSYLEAGTLFCLVGDPQELDAIVELEQGQVELVAPGQTVRVQPQFAPATLLAGTLAEIEADTPPVDAEGRVDGSSKAYRARVQLESGGLPLIQGARGQAKIRVAPRTIAWRLVRRMRQVLRFL